MRLEVIILDDDKYEIESNRRIIDICKNGVVNIDFNSREENINSNYDLNRDYNCNRKANIISDYIRKTSIVSINLQYRENDNENNNKSICDYERLYSKNRIYNYERIACIVNNSICIDVISIISKSEKEYDNINT